MYSHYSNNNSTATTSTTTAMQWNGQQWVQPQQQQQQSNYSYYNNSNSYGNTNTSSNTYMQQQQQQQQRQQNQMTNTQLVELYSTYYHQYHALYEQSKKINQPAAMEYYKYNEDMCSRLAHYFHNNPSITQPPPELTPLPQPPPNYNNTNTNTPQQQLNNAYNQTPVQQPQQQQQQSYAAVVAKNSNTTTIQQQNQNQDPNKNKSKTNDGMKRYADRCLSQYTTDKKQIVLKKMQEKITKYMKDGKFHNVNWDTEPLIKLDEEQPTKASVIQQQQQNNIENNNNKNNSYYGRAGINTNNSNDTSEDVGYYGPASVSSTNSSIKKQRTSNKKSKKKASANKIDNSTSYYGPSSITTNTPASTTATTSTTTSDFIAVPSYNKSIVSKNKRKRNGFDQTDETLSNRANRFASTPGNGPNKKPTTSTTTSTDEWDKYMGKTTIGGDSKQLTEEDFENMTIKGTCTTLEKDYLRLTAPPRSELVRPKYILVQHLNNLIQLRKDDGGSNKSNKSRDYLWFCSQLKAIRQDCTVQRIQDDFTVQVYETHAKIALEENDMNEYNQCQTQLKYLYALLESKCPKALENRNEFMSYRLIYYVYLAIENQNYDTSEMLKVMDTFSSCSSSPFSSSSTSTSSSSDDLNIKHALLVRHACCADILDYHLFFNLRKQCPTKYSGYLMDRMIPIIRYRALNRIWKGYKPSLVPITFILNELGFNTDNENVSIEWLKSCGCILTDTDDFNTKDTTSIHESNMEIKQSLI